MMGRVFHHLFVALSLFLVQGGALAQTAQTCRYDTIPATAPASQFTDNGDGTVTDTATGLQWKRCSEGQVWDGVTCTGAAATYPWQQALQLADDATFAGDEDWRLPNVKELASIVEQACDAPAIDLDAFPGLPSAGVADYWSSSPYPYNFGFAWFVSFYWGEDRNVYPQYTSLYVRLVRGTPTSPLNDTGLDWWANLTTNFLTSEPADYPGQDATYGRDATVDDDTDGHAGFAYTKLDTDGNTLPPDVANWSCVRDEITGLTWENKADDGGLHDSNWTYTWYNSDVTTNGGSAGTPDGTDNCYDLTRCDTEKFVTDVNATNLCGASDWRLPTREELRSIIDYSIAGVSIDVNFFPLIGAEGDYWSFSPRTLSNQVWALPFDNIGGDRDAFKSQRLHARLVRDGRATEPASYSIDPQSATIREDAGTVTFTITRSDTTAEETVYASTVENGGSTNNGDYTRLFFSPKLFIAGDPSEPVTVRVFDDEVVEDAETFGLIVQRERGDPSDTFLAVATFTIEDDDSPAPTPVLSVTPANTLDFGVIDVGQSSAIQDFTVQNAGNGLLSGTCSTSHPFYLTSPPCDFDLASNEIAVVPMYFNPDAEGTFIGTVEFTSNGGDLSRSVTGTAVEPAPEPILSVVPTTPLDFGPIPVGESEDRTITVQNTGTGTLSGECTTSDPFSLPNGCTYNLTAGASIDVTVRFGPTVIEAYNGVIAFADNTGDFEYSVTGTGVAEEPPEPEPQILFLQFDSALVENWGSESRGLLNQSTFTVGGFDDMDWSTAPAWFGDDEQLKVQMVEKLGILFDPYNIEVVTVQPVGQHSTVFFSGREVLSGSFFDTYNLSGLAEKLDYRNRDTSDRVLIFGTTLSDCYTDDCLSSDLANLVAHEAGHILGLNHLIDSNSLIMGYDTFGLDRSLLQEFSTGALLKRPISGATMQNDRYEIYMGVGGDRDTSYYGGPTDLDEVLRTVGGYLIISDLLSLDFIYDAQVYVTDGADDVMPQQIFYAPRIDQNTIMTLEGLYIAGSRMFIIGASEPRGSYDIIGTNVPFTENLTEVNMEEFFVQGISVPDAGEEVAFSLYLYATNVVPQRVGDVLISIGDVGRPVANAGDDQTHECADPEGATVTLDGSASLDPQEDSLAYMWTGPFGTLDGEVVTVMLPVGVHTITLTVDDGNGGADRDTVDIAVEPCEINCDINGDGRHDRRDRKRFRRGCRKGTATWACDLNEDGRFNWRDTVRYWKECRGRW